MKQIEPPEFEALLAVADALIFDCDGTLVDTIPTYTRAWAAGLALSDTAMDHAWYEARSGMSESILLEEFEKLHGLTLDRAATVKQIRASFLKEIGTLKEIETVARIARSFKGRMPMAVASGGPAAHVVPSLKVTGLMALFDTVVTFDDVRKPKSEPCLFLEAARRLAVKPARCLVFEDSDQGLEAARRAGMPVVDVAAL